MPASKLRLYTAFVMDALIPSALTVGALDYPAIAFQLIFRNVYGFLLFYRWEWVGIDLNESGGEGRGGWG